MSKAKNILNALSSDELTVLTAIGSKKGIRHSELLDNPEIVSWDFLKPVLIRLAKTNLVEVHIGFGGWQTLHVAFDDDSDGKTADLTAGAWRYKLTSVGYESLNSITAEKGQTKQPTQPSGGKAEKPPQQTPETDRQLIYQAGAAEFYNIPKATLSKAANKKAGEPGYLWSGRRGNGVFYRKDDIERLSRSRAKLSR